MFAQMGIGNLRVSMLAGGLARHARHAGASPDDLGRCCAYTSYSGKTAENGPPSNSRGCSLHTYIYCPCAPFSPLVCPHPWLGDPLRPCMGARVRYRTKCGAPAAAILSGFHRGPGGGWAQPLRSEQSRVWVFMDHRLMRNSICTFACRIDMRSLLGWVMGAAPVSARPSVNPKPMGYSNHLPTADKLRDVCSVCLFGVPPRWSPTCRLLAPG